MLETLFQQSLDFTLFLQSIGDWLTPIMQAFTFLGNEEFYLLVMPILVWLVDYRFGARMGTLLLTTGAINWIGKAACHQPRPFWIDTGIKVLDPTPHTGFGVPSGHSMNSAAVFGLFATWIKRSWVTVLAVFIFLMVGISRIYLGVHFTVDVVVGWTLGLLILWLFIKFEDKVASWFKSKSAAAQIGTAFVITIGLTLIGAGVRFLVLANGFELLPIWIENAMHHQPDTPLDPLNLDGLITNTGALFGLACGVVWINGSGGFNAASGPWWKKIVRFVVGLIGVVLFWQVLGSVLPDTPDLVGYSLRYMRYALVGFWMAGLGPWLFIKLGIGEKK
ncbi:MAG: phosphatase PAP2 family protein [Chloroflexota bacterium]